MKLTGFEKAVWEMPDQNKEAGELMSEHSAAGAKYERLGFQVSDMRKRYGRRLRGLIVQKAGRIARKYSGAWSVDVRVWPLLNGITHQVLPIAEIRWQDRGAKIELSEMIYTPESAEKLLARFRQAVIAAARKGWE